MENLVQPGVTLLQLNHGASGSNSNNNAGGGSGGGACGGASIANTVAREINRMHKFVVSSVHSTPSNAGNR